MEVERRGGLRRRLNAGDLSFEEKDMGGNGGKGGRDRKARDILLHLSV